MLLWNTSARIYSNINIVNIPVYTRYFLCDKEEKVYKSRNNLTQAFLFQQFSMNIQNTFDLGWMTSPQRKLYCLTGDVCVSCAQLLATWCYCRQPRSQSKLMSWDTLFPLVILSFRNQWDDDVRRQTLRSLWTTTHAPRHTRCPFPLRPLSSLYSSVRLSRCSCLFIFAPHEPLLVCDLVLPAPRSVARAGRAPGIKSLATLRVALCSAEACQKNRGSCRFATCQQAAKWGPPAAKLLEW